MQLAVELAYCVPLGIPHSRFLSWTEDDQDKALAWRAEQAQHCHSCGTRRDEWEDDPFAYVVHSDQCPGCELLEIEQEEQEDDAHPEKGMKVFLLPRETALALLEADDG